MARRGWERAGWSVAIGVPDAVAARLRRALGAASRRLGTGPRAATGERIAHVDADGRSLRLAAAPRVALVKEDAQATVDAFLAVAAPHVSSDASTLAATIAQESWYHTIELPGGMVTSGWFDHRPLLPHYGLPEDMSGSRALDVGTADGFWAFEMERRGAEVVALELPRLSDRDFPPTVKRLIRSQADTSPGRRFELARRALGSKVELVRLAIYDIEPSRLGKFDFVHAGDVLVHLRDPVGGLAAICSVTSGQAHIADVIDPRIAAGPGTDPNLAAYHGGWDVTTWWVPSAQTLAQMALDAGFADVKVQGTYRLDMRGGQGPWRALLRAHA
jgi:tRNA (mo5U34)-methyltransferase